MLGLGVVEGPSENGIMSRKPSIGIFLARPDRSFYLANKLRERGFEVVHYNTQRYRDDPYVRVRKEFPYALAHLLLRTNHDVYFTALSFTPSSCLYLNRLLRGKPYIYNSTGVRWEMFTDKAKKKPFSGFFVNHFYPFLSDRTYGGASRIICNSHFLESTIATRYPQYQDRLLTIYNGIEFERYACGKRQHIPGTNGDDVRLLCVTALNFKNKSHGLRLVMETFGRVWAERKTAKLVIAAKTTNRHYQEEAERYISSQPWKDAVILFYNHTDIPALLASSDICVYATPANSNDSLPRALLEAQSAGLPVVTTNTTGCPEIVRDGITGFVTPYDANALAEKTLRLMNDPKLRQDMGKEAQRWIQRTFNWDQMADKYAQVFREVIGQSPASRAYKSVKNLEDNG